MVREIIGAVLIIASMGCFAYALGIIIARAFTHKPRKKEEPLTGTKPNQRHRKIMLIKLYDNQ